MLRILIVKFYIARRVYVKLNYKPKAESREEDNSRQQAKSDRRVMTVSSKNRTPSPRQANSPSLVKNMNYSRYEEDRCMLLNESQDSSSESPIKRGISKKPPRTPLSKKLIRGHSRSSSGNTKSTPIKEGRKSRLYQLSRKYTITKDMLQKWITSDSKNPIKALSDDFNLNEIC